MSVASAATAEEVLSPRRRYDREKVAPMPKRKAKTAEQAIPATNRRVEARKKEIAQNKNLLKKKTAAIILVLFFFSLYAVLISRFSLLSKATLDIASLKSQITVAQNEVKTLESTLDAKNSITSIEDKAATELQMGFAGNNKVVYVEVPTAAEENISEDSSENSDLLASFLQFLGLS